MSARVISVVLGVWLFVSAFAWPHSQASMMNTWITGALVAIFALISMRIPEVRYVNTALAVWLFISIWAVPDISPRTTWNNAIVAVLILVASLVPERPRPAQRTTLG
jgi:hypothetical protein